MSNSGLGGGCPITISVILAPDNSKNIDLRYMHGRVPLSGSKIRMVHVDCDRFTGAQVCNYRAPLWRATTLYAYYGA